jgi:ribosomal protein S20
MNPKPRNFTSVDGWTNGPKLTQMYKTLQEGITTRGMASYATLPPEDRIALIQYIHETFTKTYPKNTEEELKELDKTYSLSTGQKMPNIIPIKTAAEKIIAENQAVTQKVKTISDAVSKNNTDEAAVLLKAVTGNMTKVLTLLAADASWLQNENQLYNLIGANPVSNGFKGRASALTPKEITMLYQYLKGLFESYKG